MLLKVMGYALGMQISPHRMSKFDHHQDDVRFIGLGIPFNLYLPLLLGWEVSQLMHSDDEIQ